MKYYILVGEASGDLHGANLMKALYDEDPKADIRFWGGNLMQQVGGKLVVHYKQRAFMGFVEILKNLFKIFEFIALCKKDITNFNPDVIIFIDNSGFNLRIAKWAKQQNFRTSYYISPQVWASRAKRVYNIKKHIDQMFVILPFEKDFYAKYNYNVSFVGHPLIDEIVSKENIDPKKFRTTHNLSNKPVIALLPGSRKQEIIKMLEIMLSLVDEFKDYEFVIAGAPSQETTFYKSIIGSKKVTLIENKTYDLLSISYAALVTSGTATLETALLKVPQVVCYKGSSISYYIAKKIITLKFISLVNLIMNKEVVKELIQKDFNKKKLTIALHEILNQKNREKLFSAYHELEKKLGGKGASKKVAKAIIDF